MMAFKTVTYDAMVDPERNCNFARKGGGFNLGPLFTPKSA